MSDRKYRPEVDGLRALSIIGVLLFHFELGFPGGFVGVDVFFVISGYLITGIILRELRSDSFSLANFWVRRIRRILPASSVMVFVTLAAGYFILTPLAYSDLGETAIAQALVVSNFIFARQEGYFTESADFTPLLHTWSLAVEEQFYILFPFLLWLAWGRLRDQRTLIVGLGFIGACSFAWSCITASIDPKAAFFLLPARGWELLVGGLLAAIGSRPGSRTLNEIISGAGLAAIIITMLVYDKLTPFPGLHALLPVAGVAMFIFANQRQLTSTGRLLAVKPVVFIGLISYSLYLWHWPLLVFSNHMFVERGLGGDLALVATSVVCGILSWRFVETPFRHKDGLLTKKSSAFTFGAITIAAVVAMGSVILQSNGLTQRLSEKDQQLLEDIDWRGDDYVLEDGSPVKIGASGGELRFALWGDSHGMAVAQTIDRIAKEQGIHGQAFLSAGVPPVTSLWFAGMEESDRLELVQRNENVLEELIESRVPNVILVGRWIARCAGYNDAEMDGRTPDYRMAPMVIDAAGQVPSRELCTMVLGRRLESMLTRMQAAGIKVWLIRQVPETHHRDTAKLVAMFKRFPKSNALDRFTTSREQHLKRQTATDPVFDHLSSGDLLEIIDPSDQFFSNNDQLIIYAERSFYRDDDHLTRAGADYYMTPIFEQIFERIGKTAGLIRSD